MKFWISFFCFSSVTKFYKFHRKKKESFKNSTPIERDLRTRDLTVFFSFSFFTFWALAGSTNVIACTVSVSALHFISSYIKKTKSSTKWLDNPFSIFFYLMFYFFLRKEAFFGYEIKIFNNKLSWVVILYYFNSWTQLEIPKMIWFLIKFSFND